MRILHLITVLTGCLLGLAGCQDDTPETPAAAEAMYQQSLRHVDYFTRLTANKDRYLFAQARQLHSGLTGGEQEASLPYGQQDLPELAAEIRDRAVWLSVGAGSADVSFQLKCFELPNASASTISLVNTTEIAAGVQYEYRISEPVLALTIRIINVRNTAWEVSREIMLSGLGKSYEMTAEMTNWLLEYDKEYQALIPKIRDEMLDNPPADSGDQHIAQYPQELLAPMFILSGEADALVGAVSDEHPLLLDRVYRLSIIADSKAKSGTSRIKLAPRYWQEFSRSYSNAKVNSGTTLRDQFALAYTTGLPETASEDGISSAALAEFATRVTHAFQFTPLKVNPRQYGSLVSVNEWIKEPQELREFIQHVADHWNVSAVVDDECIITDPPDNEDESGKAESDQYTADQCAEYAAILNHHQLLSIPAHMLPKGAEDRWVRARKNGVIELSVDSSGALAYGTEYAISLAGDEYRQVMASSPVCAAAGSENSAALRNVMSLYFQRELPEDRRQQLAGRNLLRWCSPPGGNLQLLEFPAGSGHLDQQRLLVDIYAMTYGVTPVLSVPQGTLAELLLRLTPRVSGVEYHAKLADYPGFTATTTNLAPLISESEAYGIALEPAGDGPEAGKVAYFPADLKPADAAVFLFIGMDGAVQVVNSNRIRVKSGEQSWEQEIPYGMWAPAHPDPTSVRAGDAVVIKRQLISAPSGVGGSASG